MERHEWIDPEEGRKLAVDVGVPRRVERWEAEDGTGEPAWWEGELPLGWAVAEILRLAQENAALKAGERQRQIAVLEEIEEAIEPMRACQAATFCGLDHVKSKLAELRGKGAGDVA